MSLSRKAKKKGKLPNGSITSKQLYSRWNTMRRRCYDKNFIVYRYYGGKGIGVCDEWRTDFLAFQRWALGHGWKEGLTLDRIDCSKGYEPSNCRWVTLAEQQRNRQSFNVPVTVDGVTRLICEWADIKGIDRATMTSRVTRYGWDPVTAVVTPLKKGKRNGVQSTKGVPVVTGGHRDLPQVQT